MYAITEDERLSNSDVQAGEKSVIKCTIPSPLPLPLTLMQRVQATVTARLPTPTRTVKPTSIVSMNGRETVADMSNCTSNIERAACAILGLPKYETPSRAFQECGAEMKVWSAKRALSQATFPGCV